MADATPAPRFRSTIIALCRSMSHDLFGAYRPELHYMRGPGPKCREKQPDQVTADKPPPFSGRQFVARA